MIRNPTAGRSAIALNVHVWYELGIDTELSALDEISNALRLDGQNDYSALLWHIPEHYPPHRLAPREGEDHEYLQCAGSAERLAIEVRIGHGDGFTNYAVGREATREDTTLDEVVQWSDYSLQVAATEVFTADEAIPIVDEYRRTGRIPAGLHLRPLPNVG
jgi:hypothetical protein